jgi:ligand-binding sensor domain-containing protein
MQQRKTALLFCFWAITCMFFQVRAQFPSFRAISTEHGLPSNEVYAILQDNKGFIWIGCEAGLFRYNGVYFFPYTCTTQKSKSITGLCKGTDGTIYCYNFVGQVFRIRDNQLEEMPYITPEPVGHIATDSQNRLWITTKAGLYYYNPQNKVCTLYETIDKQKPSLHQYPPTRILRDSQDNIWFIEQVVGKITPNNIFSLHEVKDNTHHLQQESLGHSMVVTPKTTTWLVSMATNRFYKWKGDFFEYENLPALETALKGKKITGVFHEKEERIWIMTFTGLVIYDFKHHTVEQILEQYAFSHFLIDKDGAYWLTTLYDGLLYIPHINFKTWTKEPEKILKIAHNDSHVYFGNTKGQLHALEVKTNQITTYTIPQTADIRSVDYDSLDKAVYFNINNVLYRLKNHEVSISYKEAGSVKAFVHLPQGYLIATSSYTHFLPNFQTPLKEREIINAQWGRAIVYHKKKQTVWIATNKGLFQYQQTNNKWLLNKYFLPENQLLTLAFDEAKETLYAINFEGKLYQIDEKNVDTASPTPFAYLPTGVQARAMLLEKDMLMIASNQGIWFLDTFQKTWEHIGKAEGLISEDVHSLNIVAQQIWLGTSKGLQSIPLKNMAKESHTQVFLTSLWVNNKEIGLPATLYLSYQDDFKIGVEAMCYASSDKFRYAYRLRPDANWSYLPAHTDFIHFSSLAIGKFKIEIKVFDHQNRASINTVWIEGEVLPPFWQNGWFLVIIFLLVAFSAYLIVRRSIYALKQKQARVLKQVMLENELKLWQQTALQTQMNPHFLFNVLNSIKTYIYENDKGKAILYLNNFANLVRKILHNSTQTQVSLAEEIHTISLYIELEAMLLEENFTWEITVHETIDQHSTYLPTFLLQPFVENAFKHGLRHKKGAKKLGIAITEQEKSPAFVVTIEDNGIGRKKSHTINQQTPQKHSSFATQNIQQRIDLINHNQVFDVSLQILDLENEALEPLGTKVILVIKPF